MNWVPFFRLSFYLRVLFKCCFVILSVIFYAIGMLIIIIIRKRKNRYTFLFQKRFEKKEIKIGIVKVWVENRTQHCTDCKLMLTARFCLVRIGKRRFFVQEWILCESSIQKSSIISLMNLSFYLLQRHLHNSHITTRLTCPWLFFCHEIKIKNKYTNK